MPFNGSFFGQLQTPSRTSASGVWPIREHALYRRAGRWPFVLPVTADLDFWIDASQPNTVLLNGTGVLAILDNSGNQRFVTQTTAARQPEYILAARNGLNAIRFTAANTHFLNVLSYTIPASHTVFTVLSRNASGVNSAGLSAGAGNRYPVWWQTNNILAQRSNGSATTHGTANTSTGWFYLTTRRNGTTSIAVRRNATLVADVTTGAGVTDPVSSAWTIIGQAGSTSWMDGDVGEIIVYSSSLSDADVDLVEDYLAEKWAI